MSSQWRGRNERGSRGAIRLIVWLALHAGRNVCRGLLVPVCAYFFVTAPLTRKASAGFLNRALGRKATWRDTFTHLLVFSTTLLDRVYLMHHRQRELAIQISNEAVLEGALAAGRGCLLLGSHLGSFELLGVVGSREKKLAVNVVMHIDDDGARLGKLITDAHSAPPYNVIPLGRPGSMLRAKECLERGEIVGILADRRYANEKTHSLPFLGSPAKFSLGPMRLAKLTGAPVIAVFGIFRGGRAYEIIFESLAERVYDGGAIFDAMFQPTAPANTLSPECCLGAYVACLERQARSNPFNWFNFYDFWSA